MATLSKYVATSTRETSLLDAGQIAEGFDQCFSVRLAVTASLRDAVYRIRHDVYCKEFRYEAERDFPNGRECDEYDAFSLHCLAIHRQSGRAAGCVRLVRTDPADPQAPLPLEKYCGHSLNREARDLLAKLPRSSICEISRLAVARDFRKRAGEKTSRFGRVPQPSFDPNEKRIFPYIATSMYLAATALTELTHRTNAIAMMEPFLPRMMSRVGIIFHQIGEVVDYHGKRAPYFSTTGSALRTMKPELRELYRIVRANLIADVSAGNLS